MYFNGLIDAAQTRALEALFDEFFLISLGEAMHMIVALFVVTAFSSALGWHRRPSKHAKASKVQAAEPAAPVSRTTRPPSTDGAPLGRSRSVPSTRRDSFPRNQKETPAGGASGVSGAALAVALKGVPHSMMPTPGERDRETQMIAAIVRTGRTDELHSLMDAGRARAVARGFAPERVRDRTIVLLLTALRACAAHRFFAEGIQTYDHVASWVGIGHAHMWSLLLYSAVEAGQFRRCQAFFVRLQDLTTPAAHDYVSMVRCHTYRRSLACLKQIFEEMQGYGYKLPQITRNRALALCVAKLDMTFAERLTAEGACERCMDAVGYATLMRGFLKACRPEKCFEVYTRLRNECLTPTEKIAGVLLDACLEAGKAELAAGFVEDLQSVGIAISDSQCADFLRGLVNTGRMDCAKGFLEVLQGPGGKGMDAAGHPNTMRSSQKAGGAIQARGLKRCNEVYSYLRKQGAEPVVQNVGALLEACVEAGKPELLVECIEDLQSAGMAISDTQCARLLRALASFGRMDCVNKVLSLVQA